MSAVEDLIRADLQVQLGQPVHGLRPIPEGHSGFTYWVDTEQGRSVLRLPPPGARAAGPADVLRQGRILEALHSQGLPVPRVLAMGAGPLVDGRPFLLMEKLPGIRIEAAIAAGVPPLVLAESAVGVLHQLQRVPASATGLSGEHPVSIADELARWRWLMERAPPELTHRGPQLELLLAADPPSPQPAVLVHGDFHYGNMLFTNGQVVGLVDWEIAELGQPPLDLSCLCVAAEVGASEPGMPPTGRWDVPAALLAATFDLDEADFAWWQALTYYKYAAIFGYNLMLHRRGKRPDPTYEQRIASITGFLERGIDLLASRSPQI